MVVVINETGDWDIKFSQSLSFYRHISINDDKTAKNEDEWDVIIGCYGLSPFHQLALSDCI